MNAEAIIADTGTPPATPSPLPALATPPAPAPITSEPVTAATDLQRVVADKNGTLGDFIERLDKIAIDVGSMHVSVWDALVVILVITAVLTGAWFASKLLQGVLKRMTKLDVTQRLLAEKLITVAVWSLAILFGIDLLGIDLTALAVFSGAFGLAIGFGLQKTFGNLIAGIILLMDRSIKPGDVIAVSDQSGASTFGQIRKIGIRAVSITTRDQKEYLIPNENLMINQVENWSYSSKNVRIQIPVGVSYNCDIKQAEQLMLEAAGACKRVLKSPPPTCWLDQYGESSVDFVIQCWIKDPEAGTGNVRSEVLKTLWDLFQRENVEIPFPQRDINLRNNAQFEQLIAAIGQRLESKKKGP